MNCTPARSPLLQTTVASSEPNRSPNRSISVPGAIARPSLILAPVREISTIVHVSRRPAISATTSQFTVARRQRRLVRCCTLPPVY